MAIVDALRYVMINREGYKVNLKEKVKGTNDALVYILYHTEDDELRDTLLTIINRYGNIHWDNEYCANKNANIDLMDMPFEISIRIIAIAKRMKEDAIENNKIKAKYTLSNIL